MPAHNIEFSIDGFNAFALVSEEQQDGARILREKAEREAAQAALEARQILFAIEEDRT